MLASIGSNKRNSVILSWIFLVFPSEDFRIIHFFALFFSDLKMSFVGLTVSFRGLETIEKNTNYIRALKRNR